MASLIKRIDALIRVIRKKDRTLGPLLRATFLLHLGEFLSPSGLESLLGGSVRVSIDDRAMKSELARLGRWGWPSSMTTRDRSADPWQARRDRNS